MLLLREINETVNIISENSDKTKNYFIEGVFLQSEVKNGNGRIYPKEVMDAGVSKYISEAVSKNRAYGEMTHPNSPMVDLRNVSHMITSLKKEGNNYIGKAKIMDTPMGNIAKGLLAGGASLGVSSRALGSLRTNNEGINVVQNDFMLTAIDIVGTPSAPDAWVNGIVEGKEWVFVDGKFMEEDLDKVRNSIKNTKIKQLDEKKLTLFQDFLKKIR